MKVLLKKNCYSVSSNYHNIIIDPEKRLVDLFEDKKIKLVPKTSLIVKLVDNQLENIYRDVYKAYNNINTSYIPPKVKKNYSFNYVKDYEKGKF